MRFEYTEVWGFEHAIRGMRQPKQSHDKSDSFSCVNGSGNCEKCRFYTHDIEHFGVNEGCLEEEILDEYKPIFVIGKNDLKLMQKLICAGSEHRKFMRQIFVSVDITAPLYWWKEFDTYKVGTVANSTSTMHKLASTPITVACFEMDDFESIFDNLGKGNSDFWYNFFVPYLERLRQVYLETKDKRYWKELIRLLPESWLQTRTVTMNYENLYTMVHQRKNHKLTEWSVAFMNWIKSLPYTEALLFLESK